MIESVSPCSDAGRAWHHRDPTIAEVLADPVVKAVMAADRVDPAVLLSELTRLAGKLGARPRA